MIERKIKIAPRRAVPVDRFNEHVSKNTGPFTGKEALSFVSGHKIGRTEIYPF